MRSTIDVVLPLFVTLFLLVALSDEAQVDPLPTLTYVGVPAAIIQGVALVWRRSRPVLVTVLALAGGLVFHFVVPEFVVPFTGLVAICSLAALRSPVVSVPALRERAGMLGGTLETGPAALGGYRSTPTSRPGRSVAGGVPGGLSTGRSPAATREAVRPDAARPDAARREAVRREPLASAPGAVRLFVVQPGASSLEGRHRIREER